MRFRQLKRFAQGCLSKLRAVLSRVQQGLEHQDVQGSSPPAAGLGAGQQGVQQLSRTLDVAVGKQYSRQQNARIFLYGQVSAVKIPLVTLHPAVQPGRIAAFGQV